MAKKSPNSPDVPTGAATCWPLGAFQQERTMTDGSIRNLRAKRKVVYLRTRLGRILNTYNVRMCGCSQREVDKDCWA